MTRTAVVLACMMSLFAVAARAAGSARDDPTDPTALLDVLSRRAFDWFQAARDPTSGLTLDRAPNRSEWGKHANIASIASVGYHLSMLPEGVRVGQIERAEAERQAVQVLDFVLNRMEHRHGLLHHFFDATTGATAWDSEFSSLDSAVFFNGCMTASEFFGGKVKELADALLDRVDWTQYVINDPKTGKPTLSLGWGGWGGTPKKLLGPMNVRSSEMAMAYFLAVGSRTHPIDPQLWYDTKVEYGDVAGHRVLNPKHPLFTSYYGLGWHDLNGGVDRDNVDLYANAREMALANRDFCQLMAEGFPTFTSSRGRWWGLSAGDSPKGYVAVGPVVAEVDGTVWPTAALAALPFAPEELTQDLKRWRGSSEWRRVSLAYGLAPFNLTGKWVGRDLIGIDLGSFYINVANHRNRTIWNLWMRHPVAKNAMERLGYRPAEKGV